MPRRIVIQPHLSLSELEQRYRQAKHSIERSHYHIIWLLAQGRSSQEVADITGYSRSWIYELVWGYNRLGPETLGDKRQENPGAEPLLTPTQQAKLLQLLEVPPAGGGQWTGTKVAAWMSEVLQRPISRQRGWDYLKLLQKQLRSKPAIGTPAPRSLVNGSAVHATSAGKGTSGAGVTSSSSSATAAKKRILSQATR